MRVYEQIRPYDETVNTLHWLYLACVWYELDTCWKRLLYHPMKTPSCAYVMLLHTVNILAFQKRLLAKFCLLGQKLLAFFNFHSHFASVGLNLWPIYIQHGPQFLMDPWAPLFKSWAKHCSMLQLINY